MLLAGFHEAIRLILTFDEKTFTIILTTLQVTLISCLLATLLGLPLGYLTGRYKFFGKNILVAILNTATGLPTVLIGLLVFIFLSRQGPLGNLELLFTRTAMVIGQTVLATPIIAAFVLSSIKTIDPSFFKTTKTLAFSFRSESFLLLNEIRYSIIAAILAAYGRIIAEVGISMMLGGNIAGYTRVMTTAITLETSRGNFPLAIALGLILLLISFIINSTLLFLAGKNR